MQSRRAPRWVAGLALGLIVLAGCATPSATAPTVPSAHPSAPASSRSAVPTFTGDPVLVGAGDIARCDSDDDEATASLIDGLPGIVFTLGDTAYDSGSEAELRDCYGPTWGRFRDRTGFVVTGNHDIRTADGAPLLAYFEGAATRDGATWFGEDVGGWHVVVLDANCDHLDGGCGPDSPQVRWLREDLAASRARCTLAMWHQPRFSSGIHGNDAGVAPFWDVLYAAGADLVLNGHDHDYERFAPQDPEGRPDEQQGITEIVAGTGGGPLRDFETLEANSVMRSSDVNGVLELTLAADTWAFRFVSTDGTFFDQGQGICH